MRVRRYTATDWEAVREIYDLSKPDEMRGGVDVSAITPLQHDPAGLALFRASVILVADDGERVPPRAEDQPLIAVDGDAELGVIAL